MHDIDRTQLEFGPEQSELGDVPEAGTYEYPEEEGSILGSVLGEAQYPGLEAPGYEAYSEHPLSEADEDQLASELLDVHNDQELDHFLGSLFHKVASAVGKVIKSPVGHALGGILKGVAKKALPIAGGALGSFVGGPLGGMVGSKLASMAGHAFGLEVEGLSPEDRDFEIAKRYVRFASHAAQKAALAPAHVHPTHAAKSAVVDAAKKFAPGLLTAPLATAVMPSYPAGVGPARYRRQGKWIRRGRQIVLLGV